MNTKGRLDRVEKQKKLAENFLDNEQIQENRRKLAELMRIAELESGSQYFKQKAVQKNSLKNLSTLGSESAAKNSAEGKSPALQARMKAVSASRSEHDQPKGKQESRQSSR